MIFSGSRSGYILMVGWLLFWPALAIAESESSEALATGNRILVPAGHTIDRDYFAAAERIEIAGTINGDAHLVARVILVSGTINGDLLASGATITITGTVAQNARILAGHLSLQGRIGRNLSVTAKEIELTRSASIEGGAVVGGLSLHVATPIARNLTVAGRDVMLAGSVGGSVNAAAESLLVGPTAQIAGRLSYLGSHAPTIQESARVGGPVSQRSFPTLRWPWPDDAFEALSWVRIGLLLMSAISTLALGFLMIGLFPHATDRTALNLVTRPLRTGGVGLAVCILTPVLIAVLAVTVIGLPLAVVLFAIGGVLLYVGRIFAMLGVGALVVSSFSRNARARGAFLAGFGLYYILRLIPVVGGLIALLASLLGIGAILHTVTESESPAPTRSALG